MGGVIRRLSRVSVRERVDWVWTVVEWVETNVVDRSCVHLDSALRFVSNGRLGDVYNRLEDLLERTYDRLTENPDEELTQYCIDHDGLHYLGEEWQNTGQCNLRRCVGQNTMKQWTCAKMVERKGCRVVPGVVGRAYPDCCPRYDCDKEVDDPIVVHKNEHRWTYEHFDILDERF